MHLFQGIQQPILTRTMKQTTKYVLAGLFMLAVALCFIFAKNVTRNSDQEYRMLFSRYYKIFSPETPSRIDFSGEPVPLELFYVKESLDREILVNTYMHSSTILMFKRANRWFPVIVPILKKYNIPEDFKFLALAESNFVNAVSSAGAEGFWQFIKGTGQKYGLEMTEEVDERYNVEKATEAACRFFLESYDEYKNWTLVAASFNRGTEGLSKALDKQKVSNYYDTYLNDETSRYVYRILALKQIYTHPVAFGFYLREKDFYPPLKTRTLTVDSTISDLPAFAAGLKINYRILREFNPWLRRYSLTNKTGKRYQITLPAEGSVKAANLSKVLPGDDTFFNDTLRIDRLR
jgi:membrane-bound lytic murein transglycosylase D